MTAKAQNTLEKMRAIAADYRGSRSMRALSNLARSTDARDRLLALFVIREESWRQKPAHFDLARKLIGNADNNCRWQALIVVSEFLQNRTDDIWKLIDEYAEAADKDMQTALFCVLLEDLYVLDRAEYRKRVRMLAKKHAWLQECLSNDAMWFVRGTLPKSTKKLFKELGSGNRLT